jgi:hypothetical protein
MVRLVVSAGVTEAGNSTNTQRGRGLAITSTRLGKARVCKRKSIGRGCMRQSEGCVSSQLASSSFTAACPPSRNPRMIGFSWGSDRATKTVA